MEKVNLEKIASNLSEKYAYIDRDIRALTWIMIVFFGLVVCRMIYCVYIKDFNLFFESAKYLLPPLTGLVVINVANRLIVNNRILEVDEKAIETIQFIHHGIIVVMDLKNKVNYVKNGIEKNYDPLSLIEIASRIELRYESLFDPRLYKYLHGKSIDIIGGISGYIFNIHVFSEKLKKQLNKSKNFTLDSTNKIDNSPSQESLADLLNELENLLDHLYELRKSIN